MANYADGAWGAAQYKLGQIIKAPEFKHKPSATIMALLKGRDMLIPASERERVWNIKESDQQSVDVNIITKQSTTAKTARAYNHTGSINDDNKATLSFVTRGRTFKYSLKGADRNIWTLAEQVAAQTLSACIDLHGTLETYFLALLNTNKTQSVVSATPYSGAWDATNYVFGVAKQDEARQFQRLRGFMREQYYNGLYDVVADEYWAQQYAFLGLQGAGNNTNLSPLIQGLDMEVSEELTADSGYHGMGYIWPRGTATFVDWLPKMNRNGFGDAFQAGGSYSTMQDPLGSGLQFAVHQYAGGADNQSAAGETQDIDVEVEITLDVAFLIAPFSTSNFSTIVKFGQKDA